MKNGPPIDEVTVKGGDLGRAPWVTSRQAVPANVHINNTATSSDPNRKQISRRKKGGGGYDGVEDGEGDYYPGSDGPCNRRGDERPRLVLAPTRNL